MDVFMKPVYMINGFLESGKTEFITYTLAQPYFQVRGKTLLILCEEGENEYDEKLLKMSRTELELIGKEEEFNSAKLIELEKKHKPERIIVEYNGMWNYGAALSLIMLLLIGVTILFTNEEDSASNEGGGVI